MGFARSFEELDVWQEGCRFVVEIYDATKKDKFSKDRDLISQMRRAAISIPSNIAEGFEKGSRKEFIRYLYIARGSAGEIRTQLYIARSLDYVDSKSFSPLKDRIIHISSMLTKLIEGLKAKE
jgi:four helix bundle protein